MQGLWAVRTSHSLALLCALVAVLEACSSQAALEAASRHDLFSKHPVEHVFHGKAATPVLATRDERTFRTRIRQGAAKGVVFAGHYAVAEWGCGAGCVSFAVIDAVTGKVTMFPATVSIDNEAGQQVTYRRDSRALHVIGSLNEKDSADRWYLWDGTRFTLIARKPAALAFEFAR